MADTLVLGGHEFQSRFILGSGKYNMKLIKAAVEQGGAQIITLALRRANTQEKESILDFIPEGVTLLPNTSGARNAEEAIRIARLSRAMGCGDFVKVEIMHDAKYLFPDNYETVKATEVLAKEGFIVLPYMNPDLNVARDLQSAGAAAVMPLAAPIGSNKGLATREMIQILIDEIDLPVIVDAGIGKPSQACEAMEMGAAAIMANTAIATAGDVPAMAEAFRLAIVFLQEAAAPPTPSPDSFADNYTDNYCSSIYSFRKITKGDMCGKSHLCADFLHGCLCRSATNSCDGRRKTAFADFSSPRRA